MRTPIDVNSDAWKQLSEDERFECIQPICARFTTEFRHLPKINYIAHSGNRIFVTTALPHGSLIDDLPAMYDGIPIEQDPVRETMDAYIATWSMVLKHIAGWPSQQIAAFANDQHPSFSSSVGFHDPPIDCVFYHILSPTLQDVCRHNVRASLEIRTRIRLEIIAGRSDKRFTGFPGIDPDYDWKAARERMAAAIHELEQEYLKS